MGVCVEGVETWGDYCGWGECRGVVRLSWIWVWPVGVNVGRGSW